jgi:hypothetical protein
VNSGVQFLEEAKFYQELPFGAESFFFQFASQKLKN